MMGHRLYELIDCDFKGQFDNRWTQLYTELPGELNREMKEVVHANYFRVARKLREFLGNLYEIDSLKFYNCLHSLCGFGNSDILQVSCFHQGDKLKQISIKSQTDLILEDPSEISLSELKIGSSSFDITFTKFTLQIRVKPMNKFTTAAYKINCSIKMKGIHA
jgi:hypothetical protein